MSLVGLNTVNSVFVNLVFFWFLVAVKSQSTDTGDVIVGQGAQTVTCRRSNAWECDGDSFPICGELNSDSLCFCTLDFLGIPRCVDPTTCDNDEFPVCTSNAECQAIDSTWFCRDWHYTCCNDVVFEHRCRPSCASYTNGHGDPMYKTLGGINFKYDGKCQYLLLAHGKQCNQETNEQNTKIPQFSVITRHGRCGSRQKDIVCIKGALITIGDFEFVVSNDNQITLNGESILHLGNDTMFRTNDNLVTVRRGNYELKEVIYERIEITAEFGLKVMVSQYNSGSIWLDIDDALNNITCGALVKDENEYLTLSDGTVLKEITDTNTNVMMDSWMIQYDNQPLICDLYPFSSFESSKICKNYNKEMVETICNKMVNDNLSVMTGKDVTSCFDNNRDITGIDATAIYDTCVTEICNCDTIDINQCKPSKAYELWIKACNQGNVDFSPLEWNYHL